MSFLRDFRGGDPNGSGSFSTARYRPKVWCIDDLQHSRREQGIRLCFQRAITTIADTTNDIELVLVRKGNGKPTQYNVKEI